MNINIFNPEQSWVGSKENNSQVTARMTKWITGSSGEIDVISMAKFKRFF